MVFTVHIWTFEGFSSFLAIVGHFFLYFFEIYRVIFSVILMKVVIKQCFHWWLYIFNKNNIAI